MGFWGLPVICLVLAVSQAVSSHKPRSSVGIIGGKNVSISDYPYMASITCNGGYDSAGVILNKRWILTAAMNVECPCTKTVRVGSTFWDKGGQYLELEKTIYNADWNMWNDNIGLLKTKKPIKFGKNVKPIKLAKVEVKVGQTGIVTGWGNKDLSFHLTETLVATNSTLVDLSVCQKEYSDPTPTTNQFCTDKSSSGPECFDDGVPFVVDGVVYGLYAGAWYGSPIEYPNVWTSIPKYNTWIKHNMRY